MRWVAWILGGLLLWFGVAGLLDLPEPVESDPDVRVIACGPVELGMLPILIRRDIIAGSVGLLTIAVTEIHRARARRRTPS